jgi:hypothetical protein
MILARCLPAAPALLLACSMGAHAVSLDTAFSYQGELTDTGQPVDGVSCDFRFGLWDAETGGVEVGISPANRTAAVTDGLFEVSLDFGPAFASGEKRWLEIEVQCPGDAGFTMLTPRTEIQPAPQAHYAVTAGQANAVAWSDISGIPGDIADGDDTGGGGQIVGGGSAFNSSGSGDNFYPMNASGRTTDYAGSATRVPLAGTITDFAAMLSAPTATGSYTFTVMKNGVDTSVTCTLTGAATLACSDLANCAVFAAGDFIAVRGTGAGAENRFPRWNAVFTPGGTCP